MDDKQLAEKAEEHLVLHRKDTERHSMKVEADKHRQNRALQERLNKRLKERQENNSLETAQKKVEKIEPILAPFGDVTFSQIKVKNIGALLESSDENSAFETLDDIQALINEEIIEHKLYKVTEEIGRFFVVSNSREDVVKLSMKIQETLNEKEWHESITKLSECKKLFSPDDIKKRDKKPVFNGPRVSFGIHSGEAAVKIDSSGHATYSGINIIKAETIGNFAQGGQTILSDTTWDNVDQSKLSPFHATQLGAYKLEGFSSACKLVEVLPDNLKDRSKFFGSVCAHCSEVIQPKEKFFRALDCIWHLNHFRCFQCNVDLAGSYLQYEGSPFCKNCYLAKTAPKCKNCSNPVTAGYINALQAYWHVDCFACKRCLKKPSSGISIYEHEGFPYCGDCYQQVAEV